MNVNTQVLNSTFLTNFFKNCLECPSDFFQQLKDYPELANAVHPVRGIHILARPMDGMTHDRKTTELDLVKALLNAGANPVGVVVRDTTLLHRAVSWGRYPFDMMQRIMDYGINVNLSCKGITPLHSACEAGNLDGIMFLLVNGANPNVVTKHGETPLHTLVMYNPANHGMNILQDATKMLIECGADQDALMTYGGKLFAPADMMRRWMSYNFRRPNQYNDESFTATLE